MRGFTNNPDLYLRTIFTEEYSEKLLTSYCRRNPHLNGNVGRVEAVLLEHHFDHLLSIPATTIQPLFKILLSDNLVLEHLI